MSTLLDLKNSLTDALAIVNEMMDGNGDDNSLESGRSQISAGGGGSGRFKAATGEKLADIVSEAAQRAGRRAQREGTAEAHTAAGDLHYHAGQEMKRAGQRDRADDHFAKARTHYGIAKALTGDLSAGNAASAYGFPGKPTVERPRGSDASYSDKGEYSDERRRNLEEAGGAFVSPDPDSGNLTCPFCQKTFSPDESVSGKNLPEIVCPRCSGIFKMADGRSIGVPSAE